VKAEVAVDVSSVSDVELCRWSSGPEWFHKFRMWQLLRCGPPFLGWLMWVISISNLYVVRALGGRASEARDSCFLHFEGITHFLTLRIKIKSGK